MTYNIVARHIIGTKCIGYMIEDENGNRQLKNKNEVEILAINKLINNCNAQMFNGNVIIKGKNIKLRDLPCCDSNGNIIHKEIKSISQQYYILGKVVKGREVVEYILKDLITKEVARYKRDEVIKLAYQRKIYNAYIQTYNNKMIIRGKNGTDLNYIKTIYI